MSKKGVSGPVLIKLCKVLILQFKIYMILHISKSSIFTKKPVENLLLSLKTFIDFVSLFILEGHILCIIKYNDIY